MENITLSQVALALGFLVSLIGSIEFISVRLKKQVDKTLEPINKKIDKLELNSIKTDLVNFMSNAENGTITTEQNLNAHELYDNYCRMGGNSYIHDKWEKLKKEGKL